MKKLSNKELRLAIDIIDQKFRPESKIIRKDLINIFFETKVDENDIDKIKPFKQIIHRELISVANNKPKLRKQIRYRLKANVKKRG
jgi:hypothetical protein